MPSEHAKHFSPSAAARWLNCTASVEAQEGFPDKTADYAEEGTEAHALCEYKLKTALGKHAEMPYFKRDENDKPVYLNNEMRDCADEYVQYVLEQIKDENSNVFVESKVDFSFLAPGGFGTADCIILNDTTINVIDFKYGKGVAVGADHNPQMMLYAIGACELFAAIYDIDTVVMHIFQPRLGNVSRCEISAAELYEWGDTVVREAVKAIETGVTTFKSGDHCRFCKAKAVCRERAKENLRLAQYDFTEPGLLTPDEIADILDRLDRFDLWTKDVRAYALESAKQGTKYKGFKLVEGRSNRVYTDKEAVAKVVADAGFDPYTHTISTITDMTAKLGKKRFQDLCGPYVTKPAGKPQLVPEADNRPELYSEFDEKE